MIRYCFFTTQLIWLEGCQKTGIRIQSKRIKNPNTFSMNKSRVQIRQAQYHFSMKIATNLSGKLYEVQNFINRGCGRRASNKLQTDWEKSWKNNRCLLTVYWSPYSNWFKLTPDYKQLNGISLRRLTKTLCSL